MDCYLIQSIVSLSRRPNLFRNGVMCRARKSRHFASHFISVNASINFVAKWSIQKCVTVSRIIPKVVVRSNDTRIASQIVTRVSGVPSSQIPNEVFMSFHAVVQGVSDDKQNQE